MAMISDIEREENSCLSKREKEIMMDHTDDNDSVVEFVLTVVLFRDD